MANKNKQKDTIEIEGELLNFVSYATFYNRVPLFTSFRIFNGDTRSVNDISVHVTGSTALILPTQTTISEIPNESRVEVSIKNVLNPKYLAELDGAEP